MILCYTRYATNCCQYLSVFTIVMHYHLLAKLLLSVQKVLDLIPHLGGYFASGFIIIIIANKR